MYYFCVAIIILAGIFALFLEHPDIHFGLAEWWVDVFCLTQRTPISQAEEMLSPEQSQC